MREDVGDVRVTSSPDLSATVSLPADINLRDRAARMNAFWRALEFQHRDVLVVALCAREE
jgi:hypothetical protein